MVATLASVNSGGAEEYRITIHGRHTGIPEFCTRSTPAMLFSLPELGRALAGVRLRARGLMGVGSAFSSLAPALARPFLGDDFSEVLLERLNALRMPMLCNKLPLMVVLAGSYNAIHISKQGQGGLACLGYRTLTRRRRLQMFNSCPSAGAAVKIALY